MTAALRGFNMELNNTSAQRVNDVYSNLAANAAANTQEIADAMTRTASIANAAGMEFETTAAFLTQMIETTRESAENLGTAMKTIVARFTEMKKSPNEIIDVEGEEVSANKVEAALKSVGVQLRDTNGEFRDLDDVFLDLSSKWDSLDKMSQRYVATTAAGSRQQSRFIAMMDNYQRTMELVGYATNSAGASQKQFDKTMDSLESKLNRLHNAWEQYVTGIADQSIIKGIVDLLTNLLTTINNITEALDPFHTGWSKILAAFLGFKAAKGIVNGVLKGIGNQLGTRSKTGLDEKQGAVDGSKYGKGFWGAFKKIRAQREPGAMPIVEKTKSAKEAMKAKGMSTKKFTLTGKDTKAAKVFREQSGAMKEQNKILNNLSKGYSDYSAQLSTVEKSNKAFRTSTQASRQKLIEMEKAYQQMDGVSEEEIANSQRRVACLESEANTIGRNTGATKLQTSANEMSTLAKETDTAATTANTSAKEADTVATTLEGRAIDAENISRQASNMTKGQALLGLFSLNREKRLAAAVNLGLATTEEVEAMATEGATGAQTAFNAALYACPIMWIIAGVAALVAGLIVLTAVLANQKTALEEQTEYMEKVGEAAKEAAAQATEAKDAFDALLENKNTYNSLYDELQRLNRSSVEFKTKALELKGIIDDLLTKYPELYKYIKSENGLTTLTKEGWDLAEEKAKKSVEKTQLASTSLQIYNSIQDFLTEIVRKVDTKIAYTDNDDLSDLQYADSHFNEDSIQALRDFYNKNKDKITYSKGDKLSEKDVPEGYTLLESKGDKGTVESQMIVPNSVSQFYKGHRGYYTPGGLLNRSLEAIQIEDQFSFDKYYAEGKPGEGLGKNVGIYYNPGLELLGAKQEEVTFTGGDILRELELIQSQEQKKDVALKNAISQYQLQLYDTLSSVGKYTDEFINNFSDFISEQEGRNIVAKAINIKDRADDLSKRSLSVLQGMYKDIFEMDFPIEEGTDLSDENSDTVKEIKSNIAHAIAGYQSIDKQVQSNLQYLEGLTSSQFKDYEDFLKISLGKTEQLSDSTIDFLMNSQNDTNKIIDKYKVFNKNTGDTNNKKLEKAIKDAQSNINNSLLNIQNFFNFSEDSLKEFTDRIGASNALKLSNSLKIMSKAAGVNLDGVGENKSFSFLSKKDIEDFSKEFEAIDWESPIEAAYALDHVSGKFKDIASEVKTLTKNLIGSRAQFAQLYDSIEQDTWADLLKDGEVTRDEVNDLKDSMPLLEKALKNTNTSMSTFAIYLNDVQEGLVDARSSSLHFIEALEKVNSAAKNIENTLDFIENFKTRTSQTIVGDNFADWRESMKQSLERGQYGDQQLIDYTQMILGIENYDEYYKEFDGNLQKIEEEAYKRINLFGQNFYGLWKDLGEKTNVVSIMDNGAINFDLSSINSIEELKKVITDTLGVDEKFAEAAIADAQTYSNELTKELNRLSIGEAISDLIIGSQKDIEDSETYLLNQGEIEAIAKQAGVSFEVLSDKIKEAAAKNKIKIEIGKPNDNFLEVVGGNLTQDSINAYYDKIKKMLTAGETVNFSSIYQNLLKSGLDTNAAKKQIKEFLKKIDEEFSNSSFTIDGSILQQVTGDTKENAKGISDSVVDGITAAINDSDVSTEEQKAQLETEKKTAKSIASGIITGMNAVKPKIITFLKLLAKAMGKEIDEQALAGLSEDTTEVDVNEKINEMYKSREDKIKEDEKKQSQLKTDAESISATIKLDWSNPESVLAYINAIAQAAGLTDGGWPSGDSNSDNDNNDWENDYDEQYNLLKKIEALERKRTELERTYNKLLKKRYLTEEELKNNKKQQVEFLNQQADINRQLRDQSLSYLRGMGNGDIWFDENLGTLVTNPNVANYNEDQMKVFNDTKSKMESFYSNWQSASSNLDTIYDSLEELTEKAEFTIDDIVANVTRASTIIEHTLTNLDREIERLKRYDSGATTADFQKRYEQTMQTLVDKYNNKTEEIALQEQNVNKMIYGEMKDYIEYDWDSRQYKRTAKYYSITDPDFKDRMDKDLGELDTAIDRLNELDNEREETRDTYYDKLHEVLDSRLEFEEKVYDAVVQGREKEIEALENIDNSISSAASDLISSVQKNLQKMRQDRQNAKTEEELQNMEARLAYLQVDTSNANQKSVLDLQKQLTDKQQSYTDSLIDQKISELQQQNDEAAQQRKRQIEIMKTQLELDKQNGVIWKNVNDAILHGVDTSGRIQKDSELYSLLSSLDEVSKKSATQLERWYGELSSLAAIYRVNTGNFVSDKQMKDWLDNPDSLIGENGPYITALKSALEAMNRDGEYDGLIWYDQEGQQVRTRYDNYIAKDQHDLERYRAVLAEYQALAQELANLRAFYARNENSRFTASFARQYDSGGLADYTGPAWLDGTPSSPELVLNQRDTKNFIQLKDILSNIMNGKSSKNDTNGDFYFEIHIDVDKVTSDYDVDQIANRIKQQITNEARYRNVNTINMIR